LRKLRIYVCEHYLPDYFEAIKREGLQNVNVEGFPALCSCGQGHAQNKEQVFQMAEDGTDSIVFCDQFCEVLELLPHSPNIRIAPSEYCFSHLTSPEVIQKLLDEGGYFIGSGWLNNWEARLKELGFDQKTAQAFYREISKKLVYFDTGADPDAKEKMAKLSEYLNLPAQIIPYDLKELQSYIKGFYNEWSEGQESNENETAVLDSESRNQLLQSQVAEYAMALDLLGKIGEYETREKMLEGIQEVFTSVLGAERFIFYSPKDDLSHLPSQVRALMKEPDAQFYFDEAERRFFIVVKHARQIHGIIEAGDFLFPKFINHYLNVALTLSNICGLMLTNIERHEESVKMALLDPLTGIYNWRYATGVLQTEVYRSSRTGRAFSLIMLDIDHFKMINDRFGHQKGDIALRAIAEIVKKRLEKTDVFTRRSGDEFLILLSDTSGEQAALLAEDLRLSVAQAKIPDVDHLTASFGVSEYRAGDTVDSVVHRADEQMYRAKQAGRNRVCSEEFV